MNKKELVEAVAQNTGFSKKDITEVVDCTIKTIENKVVSGEEVQITGFGKFGFTERAERKGYNPKTREDMIIPSLKTPKFTAGSDFKRMLRA